MIQYVYKEMECRTDFLEAQVNAMNRGGRPSSDIPYQNLFVEKQEGKLAEIKAY